MNPNITKYIMSLIQSYLLTSHLTKMKDINDHILFYYRVFMRDIAIFIVKTETLKYHGPSNFRYIYHAPSYQSINTLFNFIIEQYPFYITISCKYDGAIFNKIFNEQLKNYMKKHECYNPDIISLINIGKYASIKIV